MSAQHIAAIFPGQGSQVEGMGRDLAEKDSDSMDLWLKAEAASGIELRDMYWGGTAKDMADTRALQPALTVVNLNLWIYAAKRGMKAGAMAGHSLGEYSALAAAKAISVPQVLDLVVLRGRLMAEIAGDEEGMTALLKLTQDQAEEVVRTARDATGSELLIANYNTPGQFVISGKKDALTIAADETKKHKGRAIPLPVSGAFHSPLIQEAADELKGLITRVDWKKPQSDVYFNATATPQSDPAAICDIMAGQMTSSVRWIEIVQNQYDAGVRSWFEMGPKGVLTKMLKPNLAGRDDEWTGLGLDNMAKVDEAAAANK